MAFRSLLFYWENMSSTHETNNIYQQYVSKYQHSVYRQGQKEFKGREKDHVLKCLEKIIWKFI